ncbi:hypothetical protein ES332_A05G289300v1 [Gossypium tomentosum]|uniref:Uncharacterized protein n=1 Tax=Gossypium tomentosum TaxID=34277 RepID=A0A5D2QNZ2_GOSTO|nr:hypothetical protein ES332_A05G289300v1 [Gossypium tomentosum]
MIFSSNPTRPVGVVFFRLWKIFFPLKYFENCKRFLIFETFQLSREKKSTAAQMNDMVEAIGIPPPEPSFSSPSSSRKRGSGGCYCRIRSCCSRRIFSQNNANIERSAVPSRFMYYRCGSWLNFSDDDLQTVRTGFLERKPIIEAVIDGAKYIIDFKRMQQINYSTGNWRSVAWIDEDGKCFFPNVFFCNEDLCKSEYENERDDDINCDCKKKNNRTPEIDIVSKIDRTSSERKQVDGSESSSDKAVGVNVIRTVEWPNAKRLKETEREYMVVYNHFFDGIRRVDNGASVTSIYHCNWETHLDKARLVIFQKQIEITKAERGTSNVTYAWYGASAKVVGSVLAYGFGLPNKVTPIDVYGNGVYLSPVELPHLSAILADADENGVRHLILCRVILGNIEKVEAGSQQYLSSSVNFDTGSDDPSNPRWYVVWSHNANMYILPESVVSFTTLGNTHGPVRPIFSIQKLLRKLRGSLPPAKFEEIVTSYCSYRAGAGTKGDFTKKLRLVVGDDEFLKSAVMEIGSNSFQSIQHLNY